MSASSAHPAVSPRRGVRLFALALFGAALLWHGGRPLVDLDFWWQVKLGEQMLATKSLVLHDPFSYTFAGAPWPYKDGGAALLAWALWAAGEAATVVTAKAALFVLTGGLVWQLVRRERGVHFVLALACCVVAMDAIAFRFTERSASVALTATVAVLLLIERDRRGQPGLGWAPLLVAVLANLHRSALLLPLLLGLHAAVLGLESRIGPSRRRWRRAATIAALSSVACLATPFGIGILTTTHTLVGQHAELITEWAPVRLDLVWHLTPATLLVFVGVAVAAVLRLWLCPRSLWDGALALFALAIGLQALRHLPYLALLGVGPMASALARWPQPWTGRLAGVIATGIGGVALAVQVARPLATPSLGITPAHFPERGVEFIRGLDSALRPHGRMLNEFGYGGFLIFHLWPEYKVYIDGRTDLIYPAEFVARYARVLGDPAMFAQEVDHWDIGWVFIDNSPHRRERVHLDRDPAWVLVHASRRALIYARSEGSNAELVRRYGYQWLWAHDLAGSLVAADRAGHGQDALGELRRMIHEDPDNLYAVAVLAQLAETAGARP